MEDRITVLRKTLEERLLPLVNRDYVFLDLPYHPNVGDSLIAAAAISILKKAPYRCLYCSSGYTFDNRKIALDTLIIFNGGGNFGDLWSSYTDFRNRIIREHPDNHFLILPQSVFYKDEKNLEEDIKVYSSCGERMTICARDKGSYDFLKSNFTNNNVLLVPDLAFYTDKNLLKPKSCNGKVLFLKRRDKEFVSSSKYDIVPENAEIRDWPTMEKKSLRFYWKYLKFVELSRNVRWYPKTFWHLEDYIWQKFIIPYYVRSGIRFVNEYDVIYSTRLHVAILSMLLNKQVYFFDNSYGKNSSLYNTWLKESPNMTFIY